MRRLHNAVAVVLLLGVPLAIGLLTWGVDWIGGGVVLAIILTLALIGLMMERLRDEERGRRARPEHGPGPLFAQEKAPGSFCFCPLPAHANPGGWRF
jgi:hypothetical protein